MATSIEQLLASSFSATPIDRLEILNQVLTPELVETYLNAASPHSTGDLGRLYEAYYKVRTYDIRISSMVGKRVDNVADLSYSVTSADRENTTANEAAEFLQTMIENMKFSGMIESLMDGRLYGASGLFFSYKREGNLIAIDKATPIPHARLGQGSYQSNKENFGELFVKFEQEPTQRFFSSLSKDEPYHYLFAINKDKKGYYDTTGIMAPVLKWYVIKFYMLKFWMGNAERYNRPFPFGSLDDDVYDKWEETVNATLAQLFEINHAVFPKSLELSQLNFSSAQSIEVYDKFIQLADTNIALQIEGHTMSVDIGGGSLAKSEVQEKIEYKVTKRDASWCQEVLNENGFIQYPMLLNFPNLAPELYPKLKLHVPRPVDHLAEIRKLNEAAKSVPVPEEEYYTKGGIRPPKRDEQGNITEAVVQPRTTYSDLLTEEN